VLVERLTKTCRTKQRPRLSQLWLQMEPERSQPVPVLFPTAEFSTAVGFPAGDGQGTSQPYDPNWWCIVAPNVLGSQYMLGMFARPALIFLVGHAILITLAILLVDW